MFALREYLSAQGRVTANETYRDILNPVLYQAGAAELEYLQESRERFVRPNSYQFVQPILRGFL